MDVGKYFNFKYVVKGFYSIAKGMSTFNLNPPKKSADEILRKHNKEIQKRYRGFESDKEAIRRDCKNVKEDWEKICNDLGENLENLISRK